MTSGYERVPEYIVPSYGNAKADARFLLSKKGTRKLLLIGAVFGCLAIAIPVLIVEAVMMVLSRIEWEYMVALQSVMMFVSILMGVFLILPGVYCGMYRVLLKKSAGADADIEDLVYFYTSPRLYFRSLGIFMKSSWYLFGVGLYFVVSQIAAGMLIGVTDESFINEVGKFVYGLFVSYAFFGTIMMTVMRKFLFIFVPYAVENTSVPLRTCVQTAKLMDTSAYRTSFSGDLGYTMLMVFASLYTVGLLFVTYTAPMMLSRKVSFYRNNMVNKFNIYKE